MKIKLGMIPLSEGRVVSLTQYDDDTVRLKFVTSSGKEATLIMEDDEAKNIFENLKLIYEGSAQ